MYLVVLEACHLNLFGMMAKRISRRQLTKFYPMVISWMGLIPILWSCHISPPIKWSQIKFIILEKHNWKYCTPWWEKWFVVFLAPYKITVASLSQKCCKSSASIVRVYQSPADKFMQQTSKTQIDQNPGYTFDLKSSIWTCMHMQLPYHITCNAGVLFWESARANILDFRSRGRLGRVESVTKGVGIRLKGKRIIIILPFSPVPFPHELRKILQIRHGSYMCYVYDSLIKIYSFSAKCACFFEINLSQTHFKIIHEKQTKEITTVTVNWGRFGKVIF